MDLLNTPASIIAEMVKILEEKDKQEEIDSWRAEARSGLDKFAPKGRG